MTLGFSVCDRGVGWDSTIPIRDETFDALSRRSAEAYSVPAQRFAYIVANRSCLRLLVSTPASVWNRNRSSNSPHRVSLTSDNS
jgi:hypothetical protein